jgi:hypothetical membrane protein
MGRSARTASARSSAGLAIAGLAVYVSIDVALVFLRPEFSVLHNAESDYGSKGHYALLMDLNFLLRAALSLAAMRAITLTCGARGRLRAPLTLIGVWAVLSGALAFFADDPVGTKTHGAGSVHVLLAGIAFFAVLIGTVAFSLAARRSAPWQPFRHVLLAISLIAFIPLLLLGHAHFGVHTLGGLYEKLFIAIELVWLVTAAAFAARIDSTAALASQ